jgi:hypothetical protein
VLKWYAWQKSVARRSAVTDPSSSLKKPARL